jgi:hypothetical protein
MDQRARTATSASVASIVDNRMLLLAKHACNQTPHATGKPPERTIQNINRIVGNKYHGFQGFDRGAARAYRNMVLPCMGLFLSRSSPERQIFCPSSVSLFDLKARFFVPTRRFADVVARRSCQGWPPRQPCGMLRACQAYLDSFEHDGTLGAIGMTIRGEPAFGRGSVAPQPCIRWVQGPEP